MASVLRVRADLPPGPRRRFAMDLYSLYKKAGRPTLDTIVDTLGVIQESLRGTASKETARRILIGRTVPRNWETAEALIEALAYLADVDLDYKWSLSVYSSRESLRESWDSALETLPDYDGGNTSEWYPPSWVTKSSIEAAEKAQQSQQVASPPWELRD